MVRISLFCAALTALLGAAATLAATATASPTASYGTVMLRAQVRDRQGKPMAGVRGGLRADLEGIARGSSGAANWIVTTRTCTVTTDADGIAGARLNPTSANQKPQHWFRGKVTLTATLLERKRGLRPLVRMPLRTMVDVPSPEADPIVVMLPVFEEPDMQVGGFPVWLGRDKKIDRVVVVLEGFDLYNRYSATDSMRLIAPAADRLRARGIDILVVDDEVYAPPLAAWEPVIGESRGLPFG